MIIFLSNLKKLRIKTKKNILNRAQYWYTDTTMIQFDMETIHLIHFWSVQGRGRRTHNAVGNMAHPECRLQGDSSVETGGGGHHNSPSGHRLAVYFGRNQNSGNGNTEIYFRDQIQSAKRIRLLRLSTTLPHPNFFLRRL